MIWLHFATPSPGHFIARGSAPWSRSNCSAESSSGRKLWSVMILAGIIDPMILFRTICVYSLQATVFFNAHIATTCNSVGVSRLDEGMELFGLRYFATCAVCTRTRIVHDVVDAVTP